MLPDWRSRQDWMGGHTERCVDRATATWRLDGGLMCASPGGRPQDTATLLAPRTSSPQSGGNSYHVAARVKVAPATD